MTILNILNMTRSYVYINIFSQSQSVIEFLITLRKVCCLYMLELSRCAKSHNETLDNQVFPLKKFVQVCAFIK